MEFNLSKMIKYLDQTSLHLGINCVVFGFDEAILKVLLTRPISNPESQKWSLMWDHVKSNESLESTATCMIKRHTGLQDVYLEQLKTFSSPDRNPSARTIAVAFFSLIDIQKYEEQLSLEQQSVWFPLKQLPELIYDHTEMIGMAKEWLSYKAALRPLLFELLPEKFTIPQLQALYEVIYDTTFDKRNFSRKILSSKLIIKQEEKEKTKSRRGAFYFKLNKLHYAENFQIFLKLISKSDKSLE